MSAWRLIAVLLLFVLTGCGGPAESRWATDAEIEEFAFRPIGTPELRLYTVVSTQNGSGVHTGLLIATPHERILFDPAGSFTLSAAPERNDVHHGMNDHLVSVYVDYHARETYNVIEQRVPVSAAQGLQIANLVKSYGAVPKAQCALAVSRVLRQVDGFQGIPTSYFPKSVSRAFGRLPDVETRLISDNDGDRNDAVLLRAGER